MGHPTEHVLRQTFIALRLAERIGLGPAEREVVYFTSMVAWVGCHVDAYEQARWYGDDRAVKHDARLFDLDRPVPATAFLLTRLGGEVAWSARVRAGVAFLAGGWRETAAMFENHWRAASALVQDLGLPEPVLAGVEHTFERWDGRGEPEGRHGADVHVASRLINLADVVEVFHDVGGVPAAVRVARERSGGQFDPGLADLFCAEAAGLFEELDEVTGWDGVTEFAPTAGRELDDDELDAALAALADFVDVKSPYTLGHARGVADLAARAAEDGLDPHLLRRAGLVHDLGRIGVSNGVWDKRGRFTTGDREQVRLHPYLTDRILSCLPALAPVATVAAQHHERLDGSGYPSGASAPALGPEARLLAVADCHQAWSEPRPHRPAASPVDVAARLRAEARAGRLDGAAVEAVLRATGHRVRKRREWPCGLTAREVEVLRLLAHGLSQGEIAERLVISRKTTANHVEHIYAKTGARNRAMASLFASRHGLVGAGLEDPPSAL
ncbi:HD domain-containing protein [Nocardioides guangzhouensis]|uniref:HD domain-containing protein n=2 Tax=Nocardioides guangzhouensis TaxID=2497878 RepID=A0A4Q4Z4H9_9ACTN|nr:HD domain-containing protein [Nocardioides guangzhouensis]